MGGKDGELSLVALCTTCSGVMRQRVSSGRLRQLQEILKVKDQKRDSTLTSYGTVAPACQKQLIKTIAAANPSLADISTDELISALRSRMQDAL